MPTSLEHGPKYRCRKVNKGHRTLDMKTNGTRHDIPNTKPSKREMRNEGKGLYKSLCVHTPCVYIQREEQETSKQAMERKRCVEHMKEAKSR